MTIQILPLLSSKLRTRVFGPCILGSNFCSPFCDEFGYEWLRASFGWRQLRDLVRVDDMDIDKLSTGFLSAMYRQDIFSNEDRREIRWGDGNDFVFRRPARESGNLLAIEKDLGVFIVMDQERWFLWNTFDFERFTQPNIGSCPVCTHARSGCACFAKASISLLPRTVIKHGLFPAGCRFSNDISPSIHNLLGRDRRRDRHGKNRKRCHDGERSHSHCCSHVLYHSSTHRRGLNGPTSTSSYGKPSCAMSSSVRWMYTKHNGMSLRVKQTDSRRALAPVFDECRAIGKPGLSPNG